MYPRAMSLWAETRVVPGSAKSSAIKRLLRWVPR
jgi:hypothetical protein